MAARDWTDTEVTRRLGIRYPIVLGPMGRGGSTPELAAIVSNAGGLGSYGMNTLDPEQITQTAADIRRLTDKPFNLNLWVSTFDIGGDSLDKADYDRITKLLGPYYKELGMEPPPCPTGKAKDFNKQVEALIEARPAVFSFTLGIPERKILQECKQKGILTCGSATTVAEAFALDDAGVDFIVASGFEAGGHRASFLVTSDDTSIGSFALIPQVSDAVNVPVIAAGGIGDGRGIAAAMILGAGAAILGTAFLACDESGTNAAHRKLLFQEEGTRTTLSNAFTGRPARGIYNRYARELKPHADELAKYPAQSWITEPLRAAAISQGRGDLIAMWAGQAAGLNQYHKAAELFQALVKETDALLRP